MSIKKLIMILPPPANPIETKGDWGLVEEKIGISLPDDYKSFIENFGSGKINDFIAVFNPFSENKFINLTERTLHNYEGLSDLRSQFPTEYVHDIYPAKNGLIPFAATDNGEIFYWVTKGNPDEWKIVIYESRGPSFFEFTGSMTEFLVALVTKQIKNDILPSVFPHSRPEFFIFKK